MTLEQLKADFDEYLDKMYALMIGSALLHWDNRTQGAAGGLRTRGKALTILSVERFKMSISAEMKDFIDKLSAQEAQLDDNYRAKLRICRKEYLDNINIPVKETEAFEAHIVQAEAIWEQAKNASDFAAFAPYLEKSVEFTRKFVSYRSDNPNPYNVLLNDYEPGIDTDFLDNFFGTLKERIVPLLKKITAQGRKIDTSIKDRPVPVASQQQISKIIAESIGYDFNRGMIGETEHPFSMSFSKFDSRITTHYYEDAFLSSVFSVIHECGHSIYEQNKRDEIAESILDQGISIAVHESQSRFYENVLGRNLSFWKFIWPKIKELCGAGYQDATPEMIYEAANAAAPSLIRIEADELTYSLHIMIRYEIEKLLFNGQVSVMDLPKIWNQKYTEYLGLTPPDDKNGILQDVHWAGAMFGYFPSYALGNAYAAQLLSYLEKDLDVETALEQGNIHLITDWLKEHIHQYGAVYEPKVLFRKISGEELNASYYADYLEKKFTKFYGL